MTSLEAAGVGAKIQLVARDGREMIKVSAKDGKNKWQANFWTEELCEQFGFSENITDQIRLLREFILRAQVERVSEDRLNFVRDDKILTLVHDEHYLSLWSAQGRIDELTRRVEQLEARPTAPMRRVLFERVDFTIDLPASRNDKCWLSNTLTESISLAKGNYVTRLVGVECSRVMMVARPKPAAGGVWTQFSKSVAGEVVTREYLLTIPCDCRVEFGMFYDPQKDTKNSPGSRVAIKLWRFEIEC
jgi:hypothetical protein